MIRPADSARRPLVVELVGLPGAGKTTIAAAAIEELEAHGYLVAGRRVLANRGRAEAVRALLERARRPRLLARAMYAALATSPLTGTRIRHAIRISDWAWRLAMPRARRYDVIVLDQGVVQEGWSVAIGSPRPALEAIGAALGSVIDTADLSFALVHVDLTADAASRRLAKRTSGGSRFDGATPTEARRRLEAAAPSLAAIAAGIGRDRDVARMRLDARRPVERTASDLVAFIRATLESPVTRPAVAAPRTAVALDILAPGSAERGAAR